jgi:hypothetical protein
MPWFFSEYEERKCPDGSVRLVLKDPKKAFSVVAPTWDVRINTILTAFQQVQINADVAVKKRLEPIVNNLSENYAKLQSHYFNAYMIFWSAPCSEKGYDTWIKATEEIRKFEHKLIKLEIEVEKLTKSGKTRIPARVTKRAKMKVTGRPGVPKLGAPEMRKPVIFVMSGKTIATLSAIETSVDAFRPSTA